MASADFSQFVVTTADETACETSPVKVRILSLHAPAAFTRTSGNFWTLVYFATLSVFPSLICGSCPSGQRFAYSFFQIPSRGGHPCCSAMCFVVAYAHSGLSPVRKRPCWANKNIRPRNIPGSYCCAVFSDCVGIITFLRAKEPNEPENPDGNCFNALRRAYHIST